MHTKLWMFILCVCAAGLAACGGGSAGGGSNESVSAAGGTSLARQKSLAAGQRASRGIEMLAAPLIVEAFEPYLVNSHLQPIDIRADLMKGTGVFEADGDVVNSVLKILADPETRKKFASSDDPGSLSPAIVKAFETADLSRTRLLIRQHILRWAVVVAAAPGNGWEVETPGMGGFSEKQRLEYQRYTEGLEHVAYFSANLEAKLAAAMEGSLLKDPEDAKVAIRVAYAHLDPAEVARMWDTFKPGVNNVVDLTGKARGAGWNNTNGRFDFDASGIVWKKSGVTWFGEGNLLGKQYTLALVSTVDKTLTKTSKQTADTSAAAGEAAGAKTE